MKNKKIIITLIFTAMFLLIFTTKSDATLQLNNLDFYAQINEDGSMDVTETWNIYISETNTIYKTFKIDNSKYSYITDVEVRETTNGENKKFSKIYQEMYHVTQDCYYGLKNSDGQFEIAWGVGLDNGYGTREYQISYKVIDAIAKYDDYAELYWKFIGSDFEISTNKVTGRIYLPQNAKSKDDIKVWGHTKNLNGEIYVADSNRIEFSLENQQRYNYVEIRSLFPKDMIETTGRRYNTSILNNALQEENKWAEKANKQREINRNIELVIGLAVRLYAIICLIRTILNIIKIIIIKIERRGKVTEKIQYYRELPYENATPGEALFVFSKGQQGTLTGSFSANILDLCLKKKISLEVEKRETLRESNVDITLLDNDMADLKEEQKIVLEFLNTVSAGKDKLSIKDITEYCKNNRENVQKIDLKFSKAVREQEINMENYDEKAEKEYKRHCVFAIGGFCMNIGLIALLIISESLSVIGVTMLTIAISLVNSVLELALANRKYTFTQKGTDEREKWRAFKKYMEDFSLLKEKEIPALIVWEKYLVYATAFKISSKVLKQLKIVYPEIMDMNPNIDTNNYIHMMNTLDLGSYMNTAISSVYSSGNGSGGGFSGGGGGGRRRWRRRRTLNLK